MNAASCTFDDGCVAVGAYEDASGKNHGLIEKVAGGAPTATEAPEPQNSSGTDTGLNAVSCLNVNDCSAVGFYRSTSGGSNNVALIDQEANGAWSAAGGASPGRCTGGGGLGALRGLVHLPRWL